MAIKLTKHVALWVICAALAACGSSGDKNTNPDNNQQTQQGLDGSAAVGAACDYFERCATKLGRPFVTRDTCLDWFRANNGCNGTRFNNTQAEIDACVSFLKGLSCGSTLGDATYYESACGLLRRPDEKPAAGPGESCEEADCQPGYYCAYPPISNPHQCRTCKEVKRAGAPCDDSADCVSTAFCAATSPTSGECAPKKSNGSPCIEDVECVSGWCKAGDPYGACLTPIARGNGCDADTDRCNGHLACLNGECTDRGGATQACSWTPDCAIGMVCYKFACTEVDLCGKQGAAGAPCSFDTVCASGNFCDIGNLEVCMPIRETGGSCVNGERCVDGSYCDGVKCVAKKIKGADCIYHEECLSGYCYFLDKVCDDALTCTAP